ncbi:hypothetical protein P170DRAFT_503219 [Aspergillus steynii IBT 23096]|uniref:Methyltransferase type 12 domain-containing protein n=1 Tax=Aspergillus steynii IBT 23096 TaxID=1392250 RepID=A0A2I2FV02_9EURO|nr:uncharacterized protein P170DRAFT_503219 [Aspergillus steynii IBT 23096]PLB44470.1 hypothetical protein P170DRAFT_503219 [Aspergillus steynii IBT 23096]
MSSTPIPSNFYDTKYLAEYYDLWTASHLPPVDLHSDAPTYLTALREALQDRPSSPFTILDIGTGTGRVLINLANDAVSHRLDVSHITLLGVDKESAMIDRAKAVQTQTPAFRNFRSVAWSTGEAASISTLPMLAPHLGQIDLLLFAVGSISHLTGPDEPAEFFTQVAQLLRPGSGRAYIPIQADLIVSESADTQDGFTLRGDTWAEVREAETFSSQLYEGVVYKQFPVHSSRVEGAVKYDKYEFEVVKSAEGEERVIERNQIEISLRIWQRGKLLEWARQAGLECVRTFESSHEEYFVFKRLED